MYQSANRFTQACACALVAIPLVDQSGLYLQVRNSASEHGLSLLYPRSALGGPDAGLLQHHLTHSRRTGPPPVIRLVTGYPPSPGLLRAQAPLASVLTEVGLTHGRRLNHRRELATGSPAFQANTAIRHQLPFSHPCRHHLHSVASEIPSSRNSCRRGRLFGRSIRSSTAPLRSGEHAISLSYPTHLKSRVKFTVLDNFPDTEGADASRRSTQPADSPRNSDPKSPTLHYDAANARFESCSSTDR